ncbi:MAG: hypothetical protein ACLPX7_13785 [Xanthobacteraceae bacterium]
MRVAEERLVRERTEGAAAVSQLNDAATRTAELERQLMVQQTAAEILSRRAQEVEARLGDKGQQLAERQVEVQRLRADLDAAKKEENELREELSHAGVRSSGAVNDELRADMVQLEAQLAAALAERAKLQGEIASIRRDSELRWSTERVEHALLRERINDFAVEVARLAATFEGQNLPIGSIIATGNPRVGNGADDAPSTNGGGPEAGAT